MQTYGMEPLELISMNDKHLKVLQVYSFIEGDAEDFYNSIEEDTKYRIIFEWINIEE